MKRRLTVAQAIVSYLQKQHSSRDGKEYRFIEGIFGIFGHGNVAGIGQALEQDSGLKYYLCRNEQAAGRYFCPAQRVASPATIGVR
jgi:3D-(3,5/4)-trihydroxycyclohexane-1,2-dione acylhydrolase (decyclizing)